MVRRSRPPVWAAIIVGILALSLGACRGLSAQQSFEKGNRFFANGEWEAAIELYDEAVLLDPELYRAYGNRGLSYANLGDYEAAIADFNTFIDLNDQDAMVYIKRGSIYLLQSDYEAAQQDFNRAIELDPESAEAYHQRAKVWLALRDPEAAVADVAQVQSLDPEIDVSMELGLIEIAEGDAHSEQGEFADALEHYTTAIELDPNIPAYFSRGNIYMTQGEFDRAVDDYTTALSSNPAFIEAYNNRCIAYFQMGDLEEAFGDCTRAIELIRQDPAACGECIFPYFWRGQIRAALGDSYAAVVDFTDYIEQDDQNAAVYYLRGSAHAEIGMYEWAIADFDRAIDLDPAHAGAYNGRAWYTVLLDGDLEQALDDANAAIALSPEPNFVDTRGMIYYKLGRFDLALIDYNRAIDAGLKFSYYGRGLVYEALGETGSAADDLHDFLAVYPNRDPYSTDARQHLAALNSGHSDDVRVEPGQPILIAVLGPTSGTAASIGEGQREAARLAVEDYGPVHGFDVVLVEESASCSNEGGTVAADRVVANPAVVGVIGPVCSSSALGALPDLERAHVVLISPSATLAALPLSGPTVFNRVVLYDRQPGSPGAPEFVENLAAVQTFYTAYRSRTGLDLPSDGPVFVAYTYDAVTILLNAIDQMAQLEPDGALMIQRQALAEAVRATAGYEGLTGTITLESDGDRMP